MLATMRDRSQLALLGILLVALAAFLALSRSSEARPAAADESESTNTLTDKEKAAGWKLLFDGKTTTGWRKFKGKSVPDKWRVVDGTLAFSPRGGKEGGDIVTVDEFGSFELALEWKIAPAGNSGIMYRVSEEPNAPYESGPEYQLLDNAKHADGRNPKTCAASCYALYAPKKDMTKPVGEWNKTRLIVKGNRVEHWLNGTKVVSYELGSDDWVKRVQASKFKDMPKFGKESKGHIDLQDHGDAIAFRNIKIRVLKPAGTTSDGNASR
jgi:hypothetical protein